MKTEHTYLTLLFLTMMAFVPTAIGFIHENKRANNLNTELTMCRNEYIKLEKYLYGANAVAANEERKVIKLEKELQKYKGKYEESH